MNKNKILKNIFDFIQRNNLIQNKDKILIGLSGGADSVCLTHALYSLQDKLGITLYTAHLNHGIRGAEAERDESFAKEFSKSLSVPFFVRHADIKTEAKKQGLSEELCGREERYRFFREIMEENGIKKIATAHNKNDNAETILMNFIRGASIGGLCGIPVRRGDIIRPILNLTRDEILKYNTENNLDFVTDSTNLEEVYTRNKIRLDLIPKIQQDFNANFIETVVKNSENIRYDKEFLDEIACKAYDRCVSENGLKIHEFNAEHISVERRILYKMLTDVTGTADISAAYIDDIYSLIKSGKSGKRIDLPENSEAVMEYGCMKIRKKQPKIGEFEYKLTPNKPVTIPELGITAEIINTEVKDALSFTVAKDAEIAIRNRRNGDYFYPEGMEGKKKLKDYFIDEKTERDLRDKIGLLTADGEIMYIIGKRRDRRFAFKDKGIQLLIRNINQRR